MKSKEFLRRRDHEIFELLYRFKVATVGDIRELIFKGADKSNIYRRLKELTLMGYLQKVSCQRGDRPLAVYSLTQKSFKMTFGADAKSEGIRKQFLSNQLEHDLAILGIYKRLIESPKVADFITENVLMSNSSEIRSYEIEEWIKHHPDSILVHKAPEQDYFLPLECECSIKAGLRYETKLTHYYQSSKIPAVLYICANGRVRDAICRIEQKYCGHYRPKVFYGLIEQFTDDSEQLALSNRKGGRLLF